MNHYRSMIGLDLHLRKIKLVAGRGIKDKHCKDFWFGQLGSTDVTPWADWDYKFSFGHAEYDILVEYSRRDLLKFRGKYRFTEALWVGDLAHEVYRVGM